MATPFPHLFQPIRVGKYTLKNRIVNAGHAAHFQGEGGLPDDRYVHYVRERAKGGAAMVVLGNTVVYNDGEVPLSMANYDDRVIPIYRRMSAATHEFDTPLLTQLGHRGKMVVDASGVLGRPLMAPSAVPPPHFASPQYMPHEMDIDEVKEAVQQFADAAARVREGGLDGAEILVGLGYLIAEFLFPDSNRRTDKYGGSTIEERMTFLYEVIDGCRKALGPDLLLGVRLYDDMVDYSIGMNELKAIAPLLETHQRYRLSKRLAGRDPRPQVLRRPLAKLLPGARPVSYTRPTRSSSWSASPSWAQAASTHQPSLSSSSPTVSSTW